MAEARLHGALEEQLEALHLCSAGHQQESDSGGTNPAAEPHRGVSSQSNETDAREQRSVCGHKPAQRPAVCSGISSCPTRWVSLQSLLSLQSGHEFLECALREATDTQEHGKTTVEDESISLQCRLYQESYGPCRLLSQQNESTPTDMHWEPRQKVYSHS